MHTEEDEGEREVGISIPVVIYLPDIRVGFLMRARVLRVRAYAGFFIESFCSIVKFLPINYHIRF